MASRTVFAVTESSHQIKSSDVNTVTNSDQACGDLSSRADYVAARFAGITVAQGATINRAIFRWSASSITTAGGESPAIRAHDADNSGALAATDSYLSGLTPTTANAATLISDMPDGFMEMDVTAVIQEIVDRGGWASGNAITMIIGAFVGSSSACTVTDRDSWELIITEGANDTGWLAPTADSGSWTNPTRAYADGAGDGGNATMENSANGAHRFSGFNFEQVPAGAIILGVEVRVDTWCSSNSSASQTAVKVSKDAGSAYSTEILCTTIGTTEQTFYFGLGAAWDVTFAQGDLDADVYVSVRNAYAASFNDGRYDFVSIRVLYTEAPGTDVNAARAAELTGAITSTDSRAVQLHGIETEDDTRAAEVHGVDTTNASKAAETHGVDTTNTARAAELTGSALATDERDAELHGVETLTNTRAAELTGSQTANDTRGAETSGTATESSSRAAELSGIETLANERGAENHGTDTANDARDAELTGTLGANDARGAELTGIETLSSARAAEITGKESADDDRTAELIGSAAAADARATEITGSQSTADSRPAELVGIDTTADSRPAEVHGETTAADNRPVELTGSLTAQDARPAEITGQQGANDAREAELHGEAAAADVRAAELHGFDTVSDLRPAELHGVETLSNARAAELHGEASAAETRPAELAGSQAAQAERAAETSGINAANDSRAAEVSGALSADNTRFAELTGAPRSGRPPTILTTKRPATSVLGSARSDANTLTSRPQAGPVLQSKLTERVPLTTRSSPTTQI